MRVGLIDVDSMSLGKTKFPNLALMKLSAWHKAQGDEVEWWWGFGEYDRVYMSRVFDDTYIKDVEEPWNTKEVIKGGTGYDLKNKLPDEVERMHPDTMTEQEAWALVSAAAANAKYEAEKEFRKISPLLQKLVGSPNQLRAWALMEADVFSSVVASNFQRSYRAEVAKQKELLSLPSDVREGMQMIAAQNRALLEEASRG